MRDPRFRRTKAVAQGVLVALVTAALVFAIASHVYKKKSTSLANVQLTASSDFSITSSISSSSTSATPATLEPGVTRYLWYTVHNPLRVPITVTRLEIPHVAPPSGCAASNLDISQTTFTGTLVVPGKVGSTPGTRHVAVPISLVPAAAGQPACQNATFTFTYSGNATYTEVYATATAVSSTANPSAIGQSVTYTAVVTAHAGANQDPVPNSPTGTVSFKDGSTTICSNVALTSASTSAASAQCTPGTYSSASTHSIKAIYANADGNFTGSTSSSLDQVVAENHSGSAIQLASTPNPSPSGGTVTLTATVRKLSGRGTPTGTVSFYVGTPSGTHTLLGDRTLHSNGGATLSTSPLATGNDSLYAVFGGDSHFAGSTSSVITQVVIAIPNGCTGPFTWRFGDRRHRTVIGTDSNDFLYAADGNHAVYARGGNDCVQVGNDDNFVDGGPGDDVVLTGNGANLIALGSGDNRLTVGTGRNRIGAGDGTNNVTLAGSGNRVTLGSGANTVVVASVGGHNSIVAGRGTNTIYLGTGRDNSFAGARGGDNVCHVPSPPSSWHGSAAGYYGDSITNCRVVSP